MKNLLLIVATIACGVLLSSPGMGDTQLAWETFDGVSGSAANNSNTSHKILLYSFEI